jgi:hypothetical protein
LAKTWPFVCCYIVNLWIIYTFFPFFPSKNNDLLFKAYWTKFRSVWVQCTNLLPFHIGKV